MEVSRKDFHFLMCMKKDIMSLECNLRFLILSNCLGEKINFDVAKIDCVFFAQMIDCKRIAVSSS